MKRFRCCVTIQVSNPTNWRYIDVKRFLVRANNHCEIGTSKKYFEEFSDFAEADSFLERFLDAGMGLYGHVEVFIGRAWIDVGDYDEARKLIESLKSVEF